MDSGKTRYATAYDAYAAAVELDEVWQKMIKKLLSSIEDLNAVAYEAGSSFEKKVDMINQAFDALDLHIDQLATKSEKMR